MLRRFGILSRKRKVKAKSLSYVVITLLLVSIVLATIVLMVTYFYKIANEFENQNYLIEKSKSTRNFCKSDFVNDDVFLNKYSNISFLEKVAVRKSYWGVLEKIQFKVWNTKDTLKETLFLGEKRGEAISLYISDNNKQLKLGGKTMIQENIYIPNGTYGELYIPKTLNQISISKLVNKSKNKLPDVNDFFLPKSCELIDLESVREGFSNSFFSPTKKIIVNGGVLEGIKIEGNVVIESPRKLLIRSNTRLLDLLIVAPEIIFENGFSGNVQVLASKLIKLERNVTLNYPSVLYLKNDRQGSISIESGSSVLGAVISLSEKKQSDIIMEENTKVVGDLYSQGKLFFKGKMFGEMMAHELYFHTNESEHRNAATDLKIYKLPNFTHQLKLFKGKKSSSRILKCIK